MAVQQVLFWGLGAETEETPPVAAVATDGDTAHGSFSAKVPGEVAAALDENFTVKVGLAKDLEDWEPIDVLTYNLPFMVGTVTEFESFEQAQAAAQEAFGE